MNDSISVLCDRCGAAGVAGEADFSQLGDLLQFAAVPRQLNRKDGWTPACALDFVSITLPDQVRIYADCSEEIGNSIARRLLVFQELPELPWNHAKIGQFKHLDYGRPPEPFNPRVCCRTKFYIEYRKCLRPRCGTCGLGFDRRLARALKKIRLPFRGRLRSRGSPRGRCAG